MIKILNTFLRKKKQKKKRKNEEIEKKNSENIENAFQELANDLISVETVRDLISDAHSLTQDLSNRSFNYLVMNFTLLTAFLAILAVFISLYQLKPSSLHPISLICILMGMVVYIILFMKLVFSENLTLGFNHKSLRHYSGTLDRKGYPEIRKEEIKKFLENLKKYELKNELYELILQYQYQRNYYNVGKKMRRFLLIGCDVFLTVIAICIFLYIIPL